MSLARLKTFVEEKRKRAKDENIKWEEKKREWLEDLSNLYKMIEKLDERDRHRDKV